MFLVSDRGEVTLVSQMSQIKLLLGDSQVVPRKMGWIMLQGSSGVSLQGGVPRKPPMEGTQEASEPPRAAGAAAGAGVRVLTYAHTYICMYVRMYVCSYIRTYVFAHTRTCTRTRTHTRVHTNIHTSIHTKFLLLCARTHLHVLWTI